VLGLVICSWLLSGILGFLSGFFGYLVASPFDPKILAKIMTFVDQTPLATVKGAAIASLTLLITLALFFSFTFAQGIGSGLRAITLPFVIAATVTFAGTFNESLVSAGIIAFAVASVGAAAVASATVFASIGAVAGRGSILFAVAVTVTVAVAAAVVAAGAGTAPIAIAIAAVVDLAFSSLSACIGWWTLGGDEKYAFIRAIAVAFAAVGGTSFCGADLTNADFTIATLKSTDFRRAIVTRTRWHKTKKLDRVRPGTTYLKNAQIRQLLITSRGQGKNFDHLDLRGVNLQGANLTDASFIAANLSEANLQDADLSRAKLVQAQLDRTNLTGATLTGAYIEDWGITGETKLDGVRCEYVYMHLPTREDPDPLRKPDNRQEIFEDGDFADFIKPITRTLDLYHNQGVDPRAIAISFKQLAENNPDAELRIAAMEARGQDKFLLRVATAPDADRSALSAEYFAKYNEYKALAEQQKAVIAEKDIRICSLENMVKTALQLPSFYAQTYHHQGDIMSQASKKVSRYDQRGTQFAGGFVDADTVNAKQIGGDIHNYAPEQRRNLAEAAAEIQQLLQQLEQTYPTSTPLEKQVAVTAAIERIENNPTLKARVIAALKASGTEALKELVDHPLINIFLAAIEGWQEGQ
jgi:uncharacterized protein YjbI with pentapeptide repeats